MIRPMLLLSLAAAPLSAQAPLPKKQIVQEMRIDAAKEDLPDVSGFRVGPNGQIAIYVHHDAHLRFYDANGRRLGVFGRKGRGPGEFEGYSSFGWLGDTLWLYDPSQRRVTYVGPSLKLLRIEVLDYLNGMRNAESVPVGAIGSFIPGGIAGGRYIGSARVGGQKAGDAVGGGSRVISIPARGPGKPTDAGAVFLANEQSWSSITVSERTSRASSWTIVPFAFYPRTVFAPDGSRFAVLTTDTAATPRNYTITLIAAKGDTLFSKTYPNRGEAIPATVAETALAQRFRRASPTTLEIAKSRMPKSYPAINNAPGGIVLGSDGSIWIQTWDTPRGSSAIQLDAKGNAVLEIRLPARSLLQAATRTTLWTEVTDNDDLTSVVRYRVK